MIVWAPGASRGPFFEQGRGPCDHWRPSRPTGGYFLLVQKVTKAQGLAPLPYFKDCVLKECLFQKPFLLYAPKETVFEIQRKALTGPLVRRPIDRRVKSGHLTCRFPLPRVVAKSAPLHFRPTAKITFASLLLLSPPNPLCWASVGAPLEPPAAHGRAPDAGTCCDQACPEGLVKFYNCQKSGSEN